MRARVEAVEKQQAVTDDRYVNIEKQLEKLDSKLDKLTARP